MKIHDFTYPLNVFGPSIRLRNALRKAIKRINLRDEREPTFLKRLVAQREGIPLNCVDFSLGLANILHFFTERNAINRVLFFSPLSPRIEPIFRALKNVGDFEFSEMSHSSQVFSPRDLVYIEYPHGVKGQIFELHQLFGFVEDLEKRGVYTFVDDTLREFLGIPSFVGKVLVFRKVIVVRDVSYFLGLSTAPVVFVFSNSEIIEGLRHYFSLICPPPFLLRAVREGLKQKKFRGRVLDLLSQEKDYLRGKFKRVDFLSIEDVGLDFLLFRSQNFDEETARRLNEKGISARFFRDDESLYIWYPIRKRRENALFAKALLEILKDRKILSFHP